MSQDPATASGDVVRQLVYYTVPPIIQDVFHEDWYMNSWLLFPGVLLMAAGCKKLPPLGKVNSQAHTFCFAQNLHSRLLLFHELELSAQNKPGVAPKLLTVCAVCIQNVHACYMDTNGPDTQQQWSKACDWPFMLETDQQMQLNASCLIPLAGSLQAQSDNATLSQMTSN